MTNGVSDCSLRSCSSALRAAGWGRGAGSLSPQLADRCWHPGQALCSERCSRRAAQPGCPAPAAQPGPRARPRPRPRRGCPGREPGSGRAGRGLQPGTAALAGGTAGPPRWLCPLEGKRALQKRGCPCPPPPARRARPPLPRRGQRRGPVGSSPGRPLQAWGRGRSARNVLGAVEGEVIPSVGKALKAFGRSRKRAQSHPGAGTDLIRRGTAHRAAAAPAAAHMER